MPQRPDLLEKARNLRRQSTDAEKILWKALRSKQLGGFKFRRQHPVAGFVADFACFEAALIIELDGGQHALQAAEDQLRTHAIEAEGFRIIRFWNNEVIENLEGVLVKISEKLNA